MLIFILALVLLHPLIGAKVKVIKVVNGGNRVTNIIPSPLPSTFRPSFDITNLDQPYSFNLSQPLSPIINSQLVEEITLLKKQNLTPEEYLTKRDAGRRAFLKEEEEYNKESDKPWLPKKIRGEFSGLTKVEIRRARRLAKKAKIDVPEIVSELLYYLYVEKKVRKRDFRAYDRRLYKILVGWEKKTGQEKFWIAMRGVVEYWLSIPPNSRTSIHYIWNNFPERFPWYFDQPVPFSVLEEPMKQHPAPEEDLEGYLLSPTSPAISRLTKEKLAPVLRISSILLWHKSREECEREREENFAASRKSDMFFITPSLPSGDDKGRGSFSSKRFMIDNDSEMFLPTQLAASETEFFTAL